MGKVILVVDNSRLDRERLRDELEELEDREYLVVDFESADDAIRAIQDGLTYHVAVVDREPKKSDRYDGDDVMRISRGINPTVPIISRSVYGDKPYLAIANSVKPDYQTIVGTIEAILDDSEM
jgi:CheY-like chemotaxis protein